MRRGFTLIELMIVIAVLGVVAGWMYLPLQTTLHEWQESERDFFQEEALTNAFYGLKKAFLAAREISYVGENEIRLSGTESIRILRTIDGKGVRVEKPSGAILLDFAGGMVMGKFVSVSSKTVQCGLLLHGVRFSMFWRVGGA